MAKIKISIELEVEIDNTKFSNETVLNHNTRAAITKGIYYGLDVARIAAPSDITTVKIDVVDTTKEIEYVKVIDTSEGSKFRPC